MRWVYFTEICVQTWYEYAINFQKKKIYLKKNIQNWECTHTFQILKIKYVTFTHKCKIGGMATCVVIYMNMYINTVLRKYLQVFKIMYELFLMYKSIMSWKCFTL